MNIIKSLIYNPTTMNKANLIDAVAAKAKVSKAEAAKVIEATLEAAVEAVKNGEEIQLVGYVSVNIVSQAARMVKNPSTGAPITIPARKVVKMKAGSKFAL